MIRAMRVGRVVLLLIFAAAAGAQQFPPLSYKNRVLPNGLEVYSVQDRATPTVAIHVWYRVGSKHDPEGRSGFAHLFEHMMFKSTKNMPSEMFDRLTEDVGGFNNATTFDDATAYYEVVPSNYLQTLLWAEADRLGSLNVDEANFKSERDVVKEEYRSHVLAPPYGRLFYAIDTNSFVKHPYRRPGIGSIEQLDAATLDDVRSFHSTFYRPDNAVMVIVGDFEQQQLDGWVDQYFSAIGKPATEIPRERVQEPARTSERRVTEYAPNVPLPALAMTWLTPSASHADTMALDVAAAILSEGEASRLRQKLVRGEISQEVFAEDESREELGLFTVVSIMGSDHKTSEAEKVIRAEIAALAEKPVGAAELEKAKNLLITGALRQRETNNGKAFSLARTIVVEHDPAQVNTALAELQAVTPADVQRVVRTYLVEGKAVVIDYLDEAQKKNAGGAQ
jgi:zinc protease